MGGKYLNQRPRRRKKSRLPLLLFALMALTVLFFLGRSLMGDDKPLDKKPNPSTAAPTETEPTEPFQPVLSTATLSATGDVLMHMPVVNTCKVDGGYDFTGIFQYLDDYAAAADYAVANLETTLAGTDNGYAYSGYPCFNCPDEIAEALKEAGFDMLLTANNHCYDTRTVGLKRTLEISENTGLATLGTQLTAETEDHRVQELNGIRVGMLCYSYATADSYPDRPSMNGILTGTDAAGLINHFDYDNLPAFYADVKAAIAEMDADATVMYIHWGEEYQLSANSSQRAIAQALCDLGIDVIVGGHPHVIQPIELLTAADGNHKTVCLYSMGNAISNQQRENMNLNTGHTEDGLLFSFSFTKYADETVLLDSVEVLPTWVYLNHNVSPKTYRILTLDDSVEDWASAFSIDSTVASKAKASFDRTMALVGTGLTESNNYLTAQREAKLSQLLGPTPDFQEESQ